ncbi:hypothetical protein M406DRAFT_266790, partial [Cryphonectria parasitica EP155]
LARLFNRTITAVHAPGYGLPFDLVLALLQQSLNIMIPFASSRTLYTQVRTALLDKHNRRTVIMAHNIGAMTTSHVLRQLYTDVPTEKLSKLEIYTFGAAATDFPMPLGDRPVETKKTGGQVHAPELVAMNSGPHIEHFAFTKDPFAQIGVLRSVRENLQGRFCGSVFVLDCAGTAHHGVGALRGDTKPKRTGRLTAASIKAKISSRSVMSLNDYMSCLFPDQSQLSPSVKACGTQNRSILDNFMHIDRDLAEKREFAALAKDSALQSTRGEKKRLSWTGLGATANDSKGNISGLVGLEMARKGCKDCNGHRGREVSWLVRYVCIPSHCNTEHKAAGTRLT